MRSDHAPLNCLRNLKNVERMSAPWMSVIECFDFVLGPGVKDKDADGSSCLRC